jgi:negative regulator of flagellin synthesis FlgM
MRVNQSNGSAVQGSEVSGAKKTGKAAAAQEAKDAKKSEGVEGKTNIPGSVNAELSNKGKEMAAAKAAASEAPDVREEKIAALKARIAAGKYNVDPSAIADRMVDDHLKSGIG